MTWLTIPNLFTALRIFMTPVILYTLANGRFLLSGWIFGFAALTDMLDGTVARRFGGMTKFGAYLDPIADKCLLSGIYIGLAAGHAVPLWLVLLIFGRDLWILSMSAIAFRFTSYRKFDPSHWGKASTFLQIMTAIGVMGARGYDDPILTQICAGMIAGVTLLVFISAGEYTWRGVVWLRAGTDVQQIDLKPAGE